MSSFRLYADLHTHTIHSDGKGTLAENAAAARARGLRQVAITDHGPANPRIGMKHPERGLAMQRHEAHLWQSTEGCPEILLGIEANVVSKQGRLDVPKELLQELDIVIASLHPFVWPASWYDGVTLVAPNVLSYLTRRHWQRLRNENTKTMTEAVRRNRISFVAHPGLKIDIDTRELAEVCARRDTALEINSRHTEALAGYVEAALPSGVDFVINTDAHHPDDVGRLEDGVALAERFSLPVERIVNAEPL